MTDYAWAYRCSCGALVEVDDVRAHTDSHRDDAGRLPGGHLSLIREDKPPAGTAPEEATP